MMFPLAAIDDGSKMQNVYTPLTMGFHLGFSIVATLLYLALYYRRGSLHYLTLMFAVDLTFITQFWTSLGVRIALGVAEVLLIGATIFFYIKYNKRVKADKAAREAARKAQVEKARSAMKKDDEENSKIVDNAFDD